MLNYSSMTDEKLIVLCRSEDEKAWAELYSRYYAVSRAIASKIYSLSIEKDDLVEEGLMGFLKAVHSYRKGEDASFRTYAWTCIRNRMFSAVAHSKSKKFIPADAFLLFSEIMADIPSEEKNPEELAVARNEAKMVRQIISESLSPREQKVLRLYLTGKTYSEIATELQTSVKAVDGALQRAKAKLKKELEVQ